ncbi:hypothetical protein QU481_03830 [Crenobacter sp. SG2303]|uniref:Uncharacterized protein n=1 Tax=Crenobacter oryzisoli TaxID=3056844 RepID=A0ABT7XJY5_9NEIS|nr:hypothetical protein [Crenobacter sp. SG2303]MDN0074018.1 hypothetical protein [Crenobacter sp. SG2303]
MSKLMQRLASAKAERRKAIDRYAELLMQAEYTYDQLLYVAAETMVVHQNTKAALDEAESELLRINRSVVAYELVGNYENLTADERLDLLRPYAEEGDPASKLALLVAEHTKAATPRKGGKAKSDGLQAIRNYCRDLYEGQPAGMKHQTKLKAIRDQVTEFAKASGKKLSYDQFIKTASGWTEDLRQKK